MVVIYSVSRNPKLIICRHIRNMPIAGIQIGWLSGMVLIKAVDSNTVQTPTNQRRMTSN